MREATYNNVLFHVSTADLEFGRRTVLHEYPQKDTPYVEDLGKATRKLSVTGFVLGDDFTSRTNQLIKAIESSCQEEPGNLVHPWLGSLKVVPIETPKVSWNLEKRYATFTLTFYEAGKLENPSNKASFLRKCLDDADRMYQAIIDTLPIETIAKYSNEAEDFAREINQRASSTPYASFFNVAGSVVSLSTTLGNIFSSIASKKSFTSAEKQAIGESYQKAILNTYSITNQANNDLDWNKAVNVCSDLCSDTSLKSQESSKYSVNYDLVTINNALKKSVRLAMLGNILGASTFVATSYDETEDRTINDLEKTRDKILDNLDYEMLSDGADESEIYINLYDAHSHIYELYSEKIAQNGKNETVEIKNSIPLFDIVNERYGSIEDLDSIVTKNNVCNALFPRVGDMVMKEK